MRVFRLLCATVVSSSFSTVLANLVSDFAAYDAAHPGLKNIVRLPILLVLLVLLVPLWHPAVAD